MGALLRAREPAGRRDRARLRGFILSPVSWSRRGRDRGHFVAHAAGGGLDLNLFPQAARLNRGRTEDGKLWRRMETHAARHPRTPLYVRPIYETPGWTPTALEYGLLVDGRLWWNRFAN